VLLAGTASGAYPSAFVPDGAASSLKLAAIQAPAYGGTGTSIATGTPKGAIAHIVPSATASAARAPTSAALSTKRGCCQSCDCCRSRSCVRCHKAFCFLCNLTCCVGRRLVQNPLHPLYNARVYSGWWSAAAKVVFFASYVMVSILLQLLAQPPDVLGVSVWSDKPPHAVLVSLIAVGAGNECHPPPPPSIILIV
jgi:hypothetical protein